MQKNRCKACKQKMFYRWEKDKNGNKIYKKRYGVNYYKVSCPLCGCQWYVRRQEDNCRSGYQSTPAPVTT
jgi:hypothetical protein